MIFSGNALHDGAGFDICEMNGAPISAKFRRKSVEERATVTLSPEMAPPFSDGEYQSINAQFTTWRFATLWKMRVHRLEDEKVRERDRKGSEAKPRQDGRNGWEA
jgi:hypothetical protein